MLNDDLIANAQRERPRLWLDWLGVVLLSLGLLSLGGIIFWYALIALTLGVMR